MTSFRILPGIRSLVPLVQKFRQDPHAELEARIGALNDADEHRVTPDQDQMQIPHYVNNVTSEEFESTVKMMSEYTGWIKNPTVNLKEQWTTRIDRLWYKKDAAGKILIDAPFIRSTRIGNFGEPKFFRIEKVDHVDSLCPERKHDIRVALKREVPIECKTEELGIADETRVKYFQNYSNDLKWPLQWTYAITCKGATAAAAVEASKLGKKQFEIEIEVLPQNALLTNMSDMDVAALLLENMLKLFIDKAIDTTYTLHPIVPLRSRSNRKRARPDDIDPIQKKARLETKS